VDGRHARPPCGQLREGRAARAHVQRALLRHGVHARHRGQRVHDGLRRTAGGTELGGRMRQGGVVIGTVKKLKDPRNLGRIKVHFNWLDDTNRTRWARVATLMSGSGRGSWFMPEIDDEVLLAFHHGDMQHPYIVGYLWNGKDKPPNGDIDTSVRRIKTVTGHLIDFDDRAGKERIFIETQGHNSIELKDSPTKSIT